MKVKKKLIYIILVLIIISVLLIKIFSFKELKTMKNEDNIKDIKVIYNITFDLRKTFLLNFSEKFPKIFYFFKHKIDRIYRVYNEEKLKSSNGKYITRNIFYNPKKDSQFAPLEIKSKAYYRKKLLFKDNRYLIPTNIGNFIIVERIPPKFHGDIIGIEYGPTIFLVDKNKKVLYKKSVMEYCVTEDKIAILSRNLEIIDLKGNLLYTTSYPDIMLKGNTKLYCSTKYCIIYTAPVSFIVNLETKENTMVKGYLFEEFSEGKEYLYLIKNQRAKDIFYLYNLKLNKMKYKIDLRERMKKYINVKKYLSIYLSTSLYFENKSKLFLLICGKYKVNNEFGNKRNLWLLICDTKTNKEKIYLLKRDYRDYNVFKDGKIKVRIYDEKSIFGIKLFKNINYVVLEGKND